MSSDGKDLKKYFENDPPSFFDDLTSKKIFQEDPQRVTTEVRDLWPYPGNHRQSPTVPCVTIESLVSNNLITKKSNFFKLSILSRMIQSRKLSKFIFHQSSANESRLN